MHFFLGPRRARAGGGNATGHIFTSTSQSSATTHPENTAKHQVRKEGISNEMSVFVFFRRVTPFGLDQALLQMFFFGSFGMFFA